METWDAIQARRNVREFTGEPIAASDLERILEAGRRSPSSRNQQAWDFIVCEERNQLTRLAEVWRGAGFVATSTLAIALIAPEPQSVPARDSIQYDLGQVTMSMMVAAADLGIGSGHAGVEDQELAREVLGHPQEMFCAWLIAFGYPLDRPLAPIREPRRRSFEEVVHRDRW